MKIKPMKMIHSLFNHLKDRSMSISFIKKLFNIPNHFSMNQILQKIQRMIITSSLYEKSQNKFHEKMIQDIKERYFNKNDEIFENLIDLHTSYALSFYYGLPYIRRLSKNQESSSTSLIDLNFTYFNRVFEAYSEACFDSRSKLRSLHKEGYDNNYIDIKVSDIFSETMENDILSQIINKTPKKDDEAYLFFREVFKKAFVQILSGRKAISLIDLVSSIEKDVRMGYTKIPREHPETRDKDVSYLIMSCVSSNLNLVQNNAEEFKSFIEKI